MRIAYIELHPPGGPPLDWLRAVAGCAPNCVGIPDGVPETWGEPVSIASQWEADGEAPEMGTITVGYVGGVRVASGEGE